MTDPGRLSTSRLFAFALPAMPLAALYSPITVYLPPFYSTEMGLGLAVVGGVFIFARVWDIVTDPLLGMLSDRVAYAATGGVPGWSLRTPVAGDGCDGVHAATLPARAFYRLPDVLAGGHVHRLHPGPLSQYSWASELSADYNERSRIMGWREFFHLGGMLMVLSLPAAMEYFQGNTLPSARKGDPWSLYVLVLLPLAVGLAVARVPEHPTRRQRSARLGGKGLRILMRKHTCRRVGHDLAVGIPGGVMAYFVRPFSSMDLIRAPQWLTVILLGFFAAGLIGVPLTVRLSYRVGKHNAIIGCSVAMMFVTLAFLALEPGDVVAFAVLIIASGLVFNGINAMLRSITADITDYDQVQSGSSRAGLYYALLTLTSKIGYAFALITYPVLEWLGYSAGGESGAGAIDALRYTFVFFPLAALIVVVGLMWRFPLGIEQQRDLQRHLTQGEVR